jgi:hypothetical protein
MKKEDDIISYKVHEDDFATLNKKGKVKVWNLLSGKFERETSIEGADWLPDYSLHDAEYEHSYTICVNKKGRQLFKSNEEITDYKLEDFYEPF